MERYVSVANAVMVAIIVAFLAAASVGLTVGSGGSEQTTDAGQVRWKCVRLLCREVAGQRGGMKGSGKKGQKTA